MDNFKPFNIWFITAWFGASLSCLVFAIFFTVYLSTPKIVNPVTQSLKLYTALPQGSIPISQDINSADGRAKIIENFFKKYNSPLATYSQAFVFIADKYKLDYKLLPAISMQESNGGRKVIDDSYNPFGYGIYGGSVVGFSSWGEAIERVGKALREDYLNRGLNSPAQIMSKYTPPSLSKGGVWAKGVSTFIEELR